MLIYKKNIINDLKIINILIKNKFKKLLVIKKILNHLKKKKEKGGNPVIFNIIINKIILKLIKLFIKLKLNL